MRVPKVMKRMIGNSHRDLPGLDAVLKSQRDCNSEGRIVQLMWWYNLWPMVEEVV